MMSCDKASWLTPDMAGDMAFGTGIDMAGTAVATAGVLGGIVEGALAGVACKGVCAGAGARATRY